MPEKESEAEANVMLPQANPKRKRQDEVNLQPANSLNVMFWYSNKKFEAMQNQIDQKYREPPRKRVIHNDYFFKSKSNSLQFKFNSGLQDHIEDFLDQNLHGSTVETQNAIVSKLLKRSKLIKIADGSPAGWATIAKYEDDPFASDSEDYNRVLAKSKNKSSFTSSSKSDRTHRPQFWDDGFQHGFNPPPPPFSVFFPPFKPENHHLPKAKRKCPNQHILDTAVGDTGAVGALRNEPK